MIQRGNAIFVPAGNGKSRFIDVHDIASVAALTLTETGHANQAYDRTGSAALDYDEVVTILQNFASAHSIDAPVLLVVNCIVNMGKLP